MTPRTHIWPGRALLERMLRDERGSTLTEFIILLPIFVMVFAGIVNLFRLNQTTVRVAGRAYSKMWDEAIKVQKSSAGLHSSAQLAGSDIHAHMATYHGLQDKMGRQQIVRHETNSQADGLSSHGTMGESFARVKRARNDVKISHIDGDLTSDIGGVVDNSTYGRRLFDDGGGASNYFPSHTGGLSQLDRQISGSGLRPVLAAGLQYGSVVGHDKQTVDVAGKHFTMAHYYTTLVAPHWRSEGVATAVARSALDGIQPYDNLLGIAKRQPLNNQTQSVHEIEGNFPLPSKKNGP